LRALTLLLLLLPLTSQAGPNAADVVSAVNQLRGSGCDGRSPVRAALRPDPELDGVARQLARGVALGKAINDQKLRAPRSASIRLARVNDAPSVRRRLEADFCPQVLDPQFQAMGVTIDGKNTWIVLALPFAPPTERDAPAVRSQVLALVNDARSKSRRCGSQKLSAAPPLKLQPLLNEAALAHAKDQARNGNLSHSGSDGSTPSQRATRAHYAWKGIAENVAAGQLSAAAVMDSWLESPGHCLNLMNAQYSEMGIAYAVDAQSPDGIYWVQVFGAPR